MRGAPSSALGGAGATAQSLLREQAELLQLLLERSLALNQSLARILPPAERAPPHPRTERSQPSPFKAVSWDHSGALVQPLLAPKEPNDRPASPRLVWSTSAPRATRGPRANLSPPRSPRGLDPTDGCDDDVAAPRPASCLGNRDPPQGLRLAWEQGGEATHRRDPATAEAKAGARRPRPSVNDMFPRTLHCKTRIMMLLQPEVHHVEKLYDLQSFWGRLVVHPVTQHVTQFLVIANVLWVAVDLDYNHADTPSNAKPIFQVVGNFFTFFFAAEITARYFAFAHPTAAFRQQSFLFDLLLASLMVWETWLLQLLPIPSDWFLPGKSSQLFRALRLLRLLRALRTTRAIRNFPELMTLVVGAAQATRSVLSVLLLQTFLVYFFAIAFTTSIAEEDVAAGKFQTVSQSMYFLFKQLLIGFDGDTLDDLAELSTGYAALFMLFLFIGQLTLLNMLTGILCDVASQVRVDEQTAAFDKSVTQEVARITAIVDSDNSGMINREEFDLIVNDDKLLLELHGIGVDIYGLIEFLHSVFLDLPDGQGLSYDEFNHVVHNFCGFKPTTVKDLHRGLQYIARETSHVAKMLESVILPLS